MSRVEQYSDVFIPKTRFCSGTQKHFSLFVSVVVCLLWNGALSWKRLHILMNETQFSKRKHQTKVIRAQDWKCQTDALCWGLRAAVTYDTTSLFKCFKWNDSNVFYLFHTEQNTANTFSPFFKVRSFTFLQGSSTFKEAKYLMCCVTVAVWFRFV